MFQTGDMEGTNGRRPGEKMMSTRPSRGSCPVRVIVQMGHRNHGLYHMGGAVVAPAGARLGSMWSAVWWCSPCPSRIITGPIPAAVMTTVMMTVGGGSKGGCNLPVVACHGRYDVKRGAMVRGRVACGRSIPCSMTRAAATTRFL